jgi:type IV secretory pathway TrbL component
VKEFVSIKVSSFDHAALATSLTTKAAEGWDVVSVVAVGNDIVAYLSRETIRSATSSTSGSASAPSTSGSTGSSEPAGWASAKTTDAASAPTQAMTAMSNTGSVAADTSSTSTASASTPSSTTPTVPADWYKDPSGRYEYRYWDGQKWTEHVSRAGTVYKDPPTP